MKYLKKFNTQTQYESFKGGIDFVLPNVSYITGENSINYTPTPSIITFYIDSSPINALKGMTWAEFVNSEYNKNWINLAIQEEYVISAGLNWFVNINDGGKLTKVKATDVITPDGNYMYTME